MKAKFKKLTSKIKESKNIYLFRHIRPDPDALGSVFGLKEIIKDNFKNKKIKTMGQNTNAMLRLFPKSTNPNKIDKSNSLAIIVDTSIPKRVDNHLWKDANYSIVIDHHPKESRFTNLSIVDDKAAAACQIVASWAFDQKLKVSKKAATFLYTGLLTDSGRFLFSSTSVKTLEIASKLLACGININRLHLKLYTKTWAQGKFSIFLMDKAIIKNKVGFTFLSKKDLEKFNFGAEDAKLYANTLSGFVEIDIWVYAYEEDDKIKVSLRSKYQYSVNKVATRFGGGGHKNAAGVVVKNKTQLNKLLKELYKLPRKGRK